MWFYWIYLTAYTNCTDYALWNNSGDGGDGGCDGWIESGIM